MDRAALWQRYCDWLYYHPELGVYLDVSRVQFDEAFVERMQPELERAFQAMDALEGGGIANPDENRMVGHYWLRDPERAPTPELQQQLVQDLERIETFAERIQNGTLQPPSGERFSDVLSIGIGGSALGPQFVDRALGSIDAPLNLHFIDNTDPAGIDRTLAQLRDHLDRTLVLVISKSGGTPETYNGMVEVQAAYEAQNLDFAARAVAITGEDSKLARQAQAQGWLARFPMYDWVGGRTSEMSAVGLVPAALQGIDIRGMLQGAKTMDAATRQHALKQNPAALLALAWYWATNGRGNKDMVVLPYKDSLALLSRYLQQLVMESLGKEKDLNGNTVHQGIAVYGNKGTTDQHAYVQQLREGVPNFFATFIEVLQDRSGDSVEVEPGVTSGDYLSVLLQATRYALFEKNRESITVTIPAVTPQTVGALIALYDRAVGLYASLININAYHQPGVEAGKKAAASLLSLQSAIVDALKAAAEPLSLVQVAERAGAPEDIEATYKILRHLHANQRGVTLHGDLGRPETLKASWQGR
ncbi:MAG: glucose-6-phosphate isomerase [Cyanobacteria bacterium QS_8_64_29]|nr:MAG: glucose-6-phosphate isomerase [Cyanobacteria bacterium QS_8_64_29]